MDSYQDYIKTKRKLEKLEDWPELEPIEEAEKEKLQNDIDDFDEKISNFE